MKRTVVIATWFVIGAILSLCAFVLNAAGDGAYVPLAVCAAPAILLVPMLRSDASVIAAFALVPLYWSALGYVSGELPRKRKTLLLLLSMQYVGAVVFEYWSGETYEHFTNAIENGPLTFAVFVLVYGTAQARLWRKIVPKGESKEGWWPSKPQ